MPTVGSYTVEQYVNVVKDFHGTLAPGMLAGGFMIDLARRNLPEGELLDAISETISCLPDTIQILTPCTIGNGWLRIIDTGRSALTLFEKYGGSGVRVSVDPETLEEAGAEIYRVERVRVKPEYLKIQKKEHIRLCARCGEPFRSDTETICPFCTGDRAYY